MNKHDRPVAIIYAPILVNNNLLTNFLKEQLPIYEKAIKEYQDKTGDKTLFICDKAYWKNGRYDPRLCSLRACESKDRTDFWDIFKRIKKEFKDNER